MSTLIKVKNVNYKNICSYSNIEIPAHSVTFLSGPSGSGKSTLLKLLNATLTPSSGEILYNNENINSWDTLNLRKEILLVGQNTYLFSGTIEDNFIQFYGYREEKPPSKEDMEQFLHLGAADFPLSATCDTMSGGERQRVFLSICLSFMPKVLLLDEITSALDENTAHLLWTNLLSFSLKEKITIIAISHDSKLMNAFATTIIPIKKHKEE